jgi:aspartate/methionine/tyrosine aminotransferase
MWFRRMAIEEESPEEYGYDAIAYNLSESAVCDRTLAELDLDLDLEGIPLAYGHHHGRPDLREEIAADYPGLSADQVLVTNGAAQALFVIAATLLKPGDEVVVLHPNYPSNYEVPRSLGSRVELLPLAFAERYELDLDRLARAVNKTTRLVSLTYPHNPTGAMIPAEALEAVIKLVEATGSFLILDETYRELSFGGRLPTAASLSKRAISVSTLSKTYGLPGIRIGWIACQDRALLNSFLATKEQIDICNSILDEAVAQRVLAKKEALLALARRSVEEGAALVSEWMAHQEDLEYVAPRGGAVAFPRIKPEVSLDLPRFYRLLRDRYRTFVGPGHWFEQDDRHFRVGYGWPSKEDLKTGLAKVSQALAAAKGRKV